jgi:hypothetical protein
LTNLYSGKAVDVDRVLLVSYPERLNLRDLANKACVSLGQAFNVSKALINERLAIRDSNNELKLMAPFDLLKRLATVNNFATNTKFIEYYTPEENISKLLEKFKKVRDIEYAFTGLTGALLVAPFVKPTNVHVYVNTEKDAETVANLLGLTPIEENGNVKFAIAKSKGIFFGEKEVDGVKVVSNIQLYIDLLNYPARGEEAANEILKVIENKWKHKEVG